MAAAKSLLLHSHLVACLSSPPKFVTTTQNQLWRKGRRGGGGLKKPDVPVVVRVSQLLHDPDPLLFPPSPVHLLQNNPFDSIFLASADAGYSLTSYYTSLGLFIVSVPGLWSLIKRSVRSKIVQKTFTIIQNAEGKRKSANQVAGEILSFFTRNNFVVADRGEVITFEGIMAPSRGQAALLTFCTCISLASVALVLTIAVPDLGDNWFWLTLLSPLAGAYYWRKASRIEQIKVKMIVDDDDDDELHEVIVQGDDQQVEQLRKQLELSEKGMVYVKGILER